MDLEVQVEEDDDSQDKGCEKDAEGVKEPPLQFLKLDGFDVVEHFAGLGRERFPIAFFCKVKKGFPVGFHFLIELLLKLPFHRHYLRFRRD